MLVMRSAVNREDVSSNLTGSAFYNKQNGENLMNENSGNGSFEISFVFKGEGETKAEARRKCIEIINEAIEKAYAPVFPDWVKNPNRHLGHRVKRSSGYFSSEEYIICRGVGESGYFLVNSKSGLLWSSHPISPRGAYAGFELIKPNVNWLSD